MIGLFTSPKEEKNTSLFENVLEDFKDGSPQTRGHYTSHYVGARALLADKDFQFFQGCFVYGQTRQKMKECLVSFVPKALVV